MGLLSMFSKKGREARTSMAKLENKDLMEAIIYGCFYVASADGEIEEKEKDKVERLIRNCEQLKHFGAELNVVIDKAKADFNEGGARIIRMNAERQLADLAHDPVNAETVLNMMITVAESDGEVEPGEVVVLERSAGKMNLRLKDYM